MKNKRDKSHYLLIQINYIHCNKVQRNKVSTYCNYVYSYNKRIYKYT